MLILWFKIHKHHPGRGFDHFSDPVNQGREEGGTHVWIRSAKPCIFWMYTKSSLLTFSFNHNWSCRCSTSRSGSKEISRRLVGIKAPSLFWHWTSDLFDSYSTWSKWCVSRFPNHTSTSHCLKYTMETVCLGLARLRWGSGDGAYFWLCHPLAV